MNPEPRALSSGWEGSQKHGGADALCWGTLLKGQGRGSTVAFCSVTHRLGDVSRSREMVARDVLAELMFLGNTPPPRPRLTSMHNPQTSLPADPQPPEQGAEDRRRGRCG